MSAVPAVGRRQAGIALSAALVVALLALGATRLDLAGLARALSRIDAGWVAIGTGAMVAAFLARAESWFAALRAGLPGEQLKRSAVTRALLIGMAGSAVAPARIGEAARAWLIVRRARHTRAATSTVVGTLLTQTLLNVVALALLSVVALAASAIPGARTGSLVLAVALPALAVAALIGGPALAARGSGPLGRAAGRLAARLRQVRRGLVVLRSPRGALHCGGVQLAAWGLQWGACYAVLAACDLNGRAGPAAAAAVLVAVNVTAVVPVTPAGVGVFQAACVAVLAPFGVGAAHAVAYGLVLQGVEIGCGLALGIPALAGEGLTVGRLRAERRAGAGAGVVSGLAIPGPSRRRVGNRV